MSGFGEDVSEAKFQAAIVELAEWRKWRVYHVANVHKHLRNDTAVGFPDLVMVRAPRVVVAECKKKGGKPTAEQLEWLGAWGRCTAENQRLQVFIWYPTDWDQIEDIVEMIVPVECEKGNPEEQDDNAIFE